MRHAETAERCSSGGMIGKCKKGITAYAVVPFFAERKICRFMGLYIQQTERRSFGYRNDLYAIDKTTKMEYNGKEQRRKTERKRDCLLSIRSC